jgi:hypothetical protein
LTDWTVNGKTRARVKNSIRKVADFRMLWSLVYSVEL